MIGTCLSLVLLVAACGGSGDDTGIAPTTAIPTPTATATPATSMPSTSGSPTSPPQSTSLVLSVVGDLEVVFDYEVDACDPETIPDLAARAFRDADGVTHLLISHTVSSWMSGTTLDDLSVDCSRAHESDLAADPSQYDDREWIASIHTEDGTTVHALVHNEYQGHAHPGQCPSGEYFDCWDNSITAAISTDGGRSFVDVDDPHLVARLPRTYEAGAGPLGMREPSNVIRGPDGALYVFVNVASPRSESQWVCLMRTEDIADAAAWRFWDGTEFAGVFIDPYLAPGADPDPHRCPALDQDDIGHALNSSVVLHEPSGLYVLVGISADQIDGREVWGFYASYSSDLIDWTRRELIVELPLPWTVANSGTDLSHLYPSLLDPDSPDRTYSTVDDNAYLYFTRHNQGQGSLNRDLVRVPVTFEAIRGSQ